jgi:hypothetical protein
LPRHPRDFLWAILIFGSRIFCNHQQTVVNCPGTRICMYVYVYIYINVYIYIYILCMYVEEFVTQPRDSLLLSGSKLFGRIPKSRRRAGAGQGGIAWRGSICW